MARATKLFWDWVTDRAMPFMIAGNYSIQGAMNWLNSRGVQFSERRFVTAYRNAEKQLWSQPIVSKLPPTAVVPTELRTSRHFGVPEKYMYHFKIRTIDEKSGKVTMRSRAIYSMRELTVGAARAMAEKTFPWNYQNYGFAATHAVFDYMEENEYQA